MERDREEEPWNLGAGVSEAQVQASLKTLLLYDVIMAQSKSMGKFVLVFL